MRVSDLLLHGKENAIKGGRLVEVMELADLRELTQLIEGERRAGLPICASTDQNSPGYYLAADAAELAEYIGSVGQTRRHLEATLLRMTGQQRLGDD